MSFPTASPPDALQHPSVVHAPIVSDVQGQVGFVLEAAASSLSSCSFSPPVVWLITQAHRGLMVISVTHLPLYYAGPV
ncbi:MAG: hypothetical protein E6J31_01060 [Chloroflexi bacterium]|nr:MAG: hypothetical protein E6J31_01060 [Chloroflexota bacterium]